MCKKSKTSGNIKFNSYYQFTIILSHNNVRNFRNKVNKTHE